MMAKGQAPHHAPDEPKSRLVALRQQGYSMSAASEQVGVTERTGWNWWGRFREVAVNEENPLIQKDWVRIVRRSQGIQHTILDVLEGYAAITQTEGVGLADIARIVAGKELLKHGLLANIYSGTGTDKLQKERTQGGDTYVLALINQHAERMKPVIEVDNESD